MNNKGWGLREFLWLLCALAFFFTIAIILFNQLTHIEDDGVKHNSYFEGKSGTSIKSYIDIEDSMVEAAKKYKIENESDTVIIKLDKLITNGYISVIHDPANNKECSGYVIYNGSDIKKEYKAYLSCAGNYQTSDYNVKFE